MVHSIFRCSDCECRAIPRRTQPSANNKVKGGRGFCFCGHPNADASYEMFHTGPGETSFIDMTRPGGDTPATIKTAPQWCPRRIMEIPREIRKEEAYRIISNQKPRGLFFVKEEGQFCGLDNRTGDVWVEEFKRKTKCLEWLKSGGEKENG